MAKKFDDVLALINKFVGTLMLMILGTLITMTSTMGGIETKVKDMYPMVQDNRDGIIAMKTQVNFMLNEQAAIKPIVMTTRNEQIKRTDEIDFVQSLRGTP